jgi:hypothetical protein
MWLLASAADRPPKTRAERAKPKPRRDDVKIAQDKRGTSAALGYEPKMIFSLFSNLVRRACGGAKPDWKKERLGGVALALYCEIFIFLAALHVIKLR